MKQQDMSQKPLDYCSQLLRSPRRKTRMLTHGEEPAMKNEKWTNSVEKKIKTENLQLAVERRQQTTEEEKENGTRKSVSSIKWLRKF